MLCGSFIFLIATAFILEAFLSFLCVSSLASEFAFLYLSVIFFAFDVVNLEGVVLFGVVSLLCRFPLLFQNVVQGAGFRKNRCTPV